MNKQGAELAAVTVFLLMTLAGALRGGAQNLRFTSLDVPKAISTHVRGVDSEGTVVGFYVDQSKKSHGFLRSPQGELTFPIDYVNKSVPVAGTVINKIDPQGETLIGWWSDSASVLHGLVMDRRRNTSVSFDFPATGVVATIPHGINKSGEITGAYTDSSEHSHGFVANVSCLSKPTCYQSIDFPKQQDTELGGVNDKGEIVGEYSEAEGRTVSFLLKGGKFSVLRISSPQVHARAINNLGQIVGSYISASQAAAKEPKSTPDKGSGSSHGFLLPPTGDLRNIDFPGVDTQETGIGAINDSGTIVGHYNSRDSVSHGFVAVPNN